MSEPTKSTVGPVTVECTAGDIAVQEALVRAEGRSMTWVAFPALSTGAFGYPLEDAARVAMETVVSRAPGLASVRRVRFVLYDDRALDRALEGPS